MLYQNCQWQDLNPGSLASEEINLPTVLISLDKFFNFKAHLPTFANIFSSLPPKFIKNCFFVEAEFDQVQLDWFDHLVRSANETKFSFFFFESGKCRRQNFKVDSSGFHSVLKILEST